MREGHGSPFEKGYFEFHVEAPIFVFREWHRHRVGHSYNEMSGRYTKMEPKFYRPETVRSQKGSPGKYIFEELGKAAGLGIDGILDTAYQMSWKTYETLLANGVAKEQARAVLPLGLYSQMIWSCNPRSLMHFLSLRNAPDAQEEIRECARQAEEIFTEIMPVTASEFVKNSRVTP